MGHADDLYHRLICRPRPTHLRARGDHGEGEADRSSWADARGSLGMLTLSDEQLGASDNSHMSYAGAAMPVRTNSEQDQAPTSTGQPTSRRERGSGRVYFDAS